MLTEIIRRFGLLIARLVTAAFALAALVWVFKAAPVITSQTGVTDIATHMLDGENYKPETMDAVIAAINRDARPTSRGSYYNRIAVVRLRSTENAMKSGILPAIDENLTALRKAVDLSLANSPNDPFLWMVRTWAENTASGITPEHLKSLRMSYLLGPREGWIAMKRNAFALTMFTRLPPDLAQQTLTEFAGLVRSGLYEAAADAVAGPGVAVRKQLMAQLVDVPERERRLFARVLYTRDVEDVVVPGTEPPPPRPFLR